MRGYSRVAVDGVKFWLGNETGITHTWTDTSATNGQTYYYAVCSYDFGSPLSVPDSLAFYPSENSIPVSQTLRGGLLLPRNVVAARPEPNVPGFITARTDTAARLSGNGDGSVRIEVVNGALVPDNHVLKLAFLASSPNTVHAEAYALVDSTTGDTLITAGHDFDGAGSGQVGGGLLPIVQTPPAVLVDASSGFNRSLTDVEIEAKYVGTKSANLRRPGYPADLRIVFYDTVADTSGIFPPLIRRMPAKFKIFAKADTGWRRLAFGFDDSTKHVPDSTLADPKDILIATDYSSAFPTVLDETYQFFADTLASRKPARGDTTFHLRKPAAGDTFNLHLQVPFGPSDAFVFRSHGSRVDAATARTQFAQSPYVVPNPYVGSASFEPRPFAESGRGSRLMEFRNVPKGAMVRIYTVHGDLVRALPQDGMDQGYVPWDLRTKDNLDVAPGLYVFHVGAQGVGDYVGKFAIIK